MGRVNIVKQVKVDGKWILRSIPKKKSGHYDWAALPDGDYFVEWREDGRRRRQPAGNTAAQAMEEQRRKRHELEAHALGLAPRNETSEAVTPIEPASVRRLLDRYLDQIKTLKKPNTHRKYDAVLTRFAKVFDRRTLNSITTEELNDYVVALMKSGMSANTVLHNVVIIAQFCKRNGRPGLTRLLHLPERISPLPLEYTEEELASFFVFVYSVEPPINTGFRRKNWTKAEIYSKVKFVFQGHPRGSSASGVGAGTPGYARGARPGPAGARPSPATSGGAGSSAPGFGNRTSAVNVARQI